MLTVECFFKFSDKNIKDAILKNYEDDEAEEEYTQRNARIDDAERGDDNAEATAADLAK